MDEWIGRKIALNTNYVGGYALVSWGVSSNVLTLFNLLLFYPNKVERDNRTKDLDSDVQLNRILMCRRREGATSTN